MTKSLDNKYSDVMFENITKIYYKYLFTKEHFDIYFFMKNLKLNDLFLEMLTNHLYHIIPEKNKNILLKKISEVQILDDIRTSILEIFNMFSRNFEQNDEFEDLPFMLEQFDCESKTSDLFFNSLKYDSQNIYIENYLRVADRDVNEPIQNIVSNRDYSLKNVCKISDFLTYLETDPTLSSLALVPRMARGDRDRDEDFGGGSFSDPTDDRNDTAPSSGDLININKLSPFKSITLGVRIIYLADNENIGNGLNINTLNQNEFFKKEKCWALSGRANSNQLRNSIMKFPLEIVRSESENLIELYGEELVKKIRNTISYNELNKKLLSSLITDNSYKNFFGQIVPTKLISIMNYGHFKKISRMMRETIEKNGVFRNMDEDLFKLVNQFIEYKDFSK